MIVYPVQRTRGPHHHLAPAPVPVSLAPVRLVEVTDRDIGLDPRSCTTTQADAERVIRAAIRERLHADAVRRAAALEIEVDDAAMHVAHITMHQIGREMHRLVDLSERRRMSLAS